MFQYFRVQRQLERVLPGLSAISIVLLERDARLVFTIRQLNNPPGNVKRRVMEDSSTMVLTRYISMPIGGSR